MSRAHVRERGEETGRENVEVGGPEVDCSVGVSSENGQRGRKDDDFAVIGST